jgi:hypothetical protein
VGDKLGGTWELLRKQRKPYPIIRLRMQKINLPVLGPIAGLFSLIFQPLLMLFDLVRGGFQDLTPKSCESNKIILEAGEVWTRRTGPVL